MPRGCCCFPVCQSSTGAVVADDAHAALCPDISKFPQFYNTLAALQSWRPDDSATEARLCPLIVSTVWHVLATSVEGGFSC